MNLLDLEAVLHLDISQFKQALGIAEGRAKSAGGSGGGFTVLKGALANLASGGIAAVAGALTNNLGAAFKRVDTLNNYSTVMSNLGKDSKAAKEEVNRLSEGIDGLPTALDQIVSSQQQFAALGGKLSDATDLTIALNNATLAGGKGQVVANSAMQQWYQMIAAGKSDMMSMRIINEAMPAQMDAIAKSVMGEKATWQDLHEEWKSNPEITKKVKDAILDLNENGYKVGGKEAKAFKDQAIDANKGIETSMQNVQTSITKGLANLLNEGVGQETIANLFNGIKETVNNIFGSKDENGDWTGIIGSIQRIKEAFSEGGIGDAASTFINEIRDGMVKGIENLGDFLFKQLSSINEILFAEGFADNIDVAKAFDDVVQKFVDFLPQVLPRLGELFNTLAEWLSNNGAEMIVSLGKGFLLALPDIISFMGQITNGILKVVVGIPVRLLAMGLSAAGKFALGLLKGIGKAVSSAGKLVGRVLKAIGKFASGALKAAWNGVKSFAQGIAKGVGTAVAKAGLFVQKVYNKIKNGFKNVLDIGTNIVKGIWNGISDGFGWIKGKIKEWVGNVVDFFKDVLGIGSPSKVFANEIGKWIPLGIAKGIEDNVGAVSDAVDDAVDIPDMAGDVIESGSLEGGMKMVSFAPNITVDGAENPEEYAMRLMREMKMEARMA